MIAWNSTKFVLSCCLLLSLMCSIPSSRCLADEVNWDGSAGDEDDPRRGDNTHWFDPLNWDVDHIPGPGDDADVGMGHPLILENELFQIADLEVGMDGGLELRGALNSTGGEVHNDGEIFIDNGAMPGPAGLAVGVGTLEGSGEVILGDSDFANSGARLVGPSVEGSTTHAAGHTIRGEGTITGNWINEGLILPDDISGDSMGTLRIQAASMTNNGILQSSPMVDLDLNTGNGILTQGVTGRLISDTRKITLRPSTIIGGAMEAANGGYFQTGAGSLHLNQVHNLAPIDVINASATSLFVEGGGIVNDGTIVIANETTPAGSLFFSGASEISGSGEVILNKPGLGARIQGTVGAVGTNGAGHTIRGIGSIDVNLVNNGTIIAEPRTGGTVLEFHDANSDSMTTNNNVIRADAGGILRLRNVLLSQNESTGRIIANEGTVELQSGQLNKPLIDGGRLETVGAGTIEVVANTRIDNVTNEGALNIQQSRQLSIGGPSFTNNNTITFRSGCTPGCSSAAMAFIGNVTLDGTGEFVLAPNAGTTFNRIIVNNSFTATQAEGHTIRGEGHIDGPGTFINNGQVLGTSATDFIEVNGTIEGNGLLRNVRIDGTHSPGESTAIVPLEGAYTIGNFGGTLDIEIGGTTAGTEYDQLFSTDASNLITIGTSQTTLNVSFVDLGNSYLPAVGDRFTIMSSPNSIVGEFDTINLSSFGFGHNITWAPVDRSDPTKYVLEIAAISDFFFEADFDEDGDVDGDDLTRWQAGYGTTTAAAHMDGNADGDLDVDGRDFLVWQRQAGMVFATLPSITPGNVPEPASFALLVVTLPLLTTSYLGNGRRSFRSAGQ